MTTETTTYNVYRVYFKQIDKPDHQGIALVPAQMADQGRGRFYHVTGDLGLGMDYDLRPGYNFRGTKSYKSSAFQFQIPKEKLSEFEGIAAKQRVPHDPRVLTDKNPSPPPRNCSDWVDDVLKEARNKLVG
ncbi:hypothetical protein N7475_003669 [Penicillium sp. IBT 31633x]|nr:hypothetical protein N7475_003669 [Penicillium sp. IBT 31633x]